MTKTKNIKVAYCCICIIGIHTNARPLMNSGARKAVSLGTTCAIKQMCFVLSPMHFG